MQRREFFSLAAAGLAAAPSSLAESRAHRLDDLLRKIEGLVREEIPDVTSVRVQYDPLNAEVPLMIMAFRF